MPTTHKEIDDLIAHVKALRDYAMDHVGKSDEETLKNDCETLTWASNEYELILEKVQHLRIDPLPPSEILDANAIPPERANWARVQFRNIHKWCGHVVDELEAAKYNLPANPSATEKVADKKPEKKGFFGWLWLLAKMFLIIGLLLLCVTAGLWWWSNRPEDGATDEPVENTAVNPDDLPFDCAHAQTQTGDLYEQNIATQFTVIPLKSGAALYVANAVHDNGVCKIGKGTISVGNMRDIRTAISTSGMQTPDNENIPITPRVNVAPWGSEKAKLTVRCNLGPAESIDACWGE